MNLALGHPGATAGDPNRIVALWRRSADLKGTPTAQGSQCRRGGTELLTAIIGSNRRRNTPRYAKTSHNIQNYAPHSHSIVLNDHNSLI
jgi:hypothetical protein